MIEIGESKRPSVFDEVQASDRRNVRKCCVPIVRVKNIPFVTAPGAVGANQFVDGVPSLLVVARSARLIRRICDHLPPEEAIEIRARRAGYHAIDDVKILKTVVIEIKRIARPRPPSHSDGCWFRHSVKGGASIEQQRISHRMLLIKSPNFG